MPAPTGHVEWHGSETTGHWRTRVTYADGTRRWERLDGLTQAEKARAKKRALLVQVGARTRLPTPGPRARTPEPEGESVEEYGARWLDDRRRQGRADVDGEAGTLRRYLYPHLGARVLASITRADLERVVERLDDAVRAPVKPLSWKTALNVWSVVRKLFHDAASSKRLALRVLDVNPARDVAPPDRGRSRAKQFLWPSELLAVARCAEVPIPWRRLVCLAAYTGLRAGELSALQVGDVDRRRWIVTVTESVTTRGRRRGPVKLPKTQAGARSFVVEPHLRPLLAAMLDGRREGPVVEAFRTDGPDGAAGRLRLYLRRAGVSRPELFATTVARKAITWHDLRATYATWCAIRGDAPLTIRQRAGHESLDTTMGYVRAAEVLDRELVGEVFPPLPLAELRVTGEGGVSPGVSPAGAGDRKSAVDMGETWCPQRESKALCAPSICPAAADSAGSASAAGAGGGAVDGAGRGPASPAGTAPGTASDLARLVGELVAAGQIDAARLVLEGMLRAQGGVAAVVDLAAVRALRGG